MNKEQVTAVMDDLEVKQDLYRLHKLEKEYNDLSDKCNKLYTFIYSLDFPDKARNVDEQILLQEQHKRMEAYRTNLYQRIQFYRNLIAVNNGYDILTPWREVAEKIDQEAVESAAHHCGQDACCQVDDGNADVDMPVLAGESLKTLMDYQVVNVCVPKCKDCPCGDGLREYPSGRDMSSCVKLELVGGAYLCLAPLPNSIVTE